MGIKCLCNNCSGHLEFESTDAGRRVDRPHCGMETLLYIPQAPLPPSLPVASIVPPPRLENSNLRPCGFCGKQVSDHAECCPSCGATFIRRKKHGVFFYGFLGVICLASLLIGFATGRFSKTATSGVTATSAVERTAQVGKVLTGQEWSKSLSVTQENIQVVVVSANVGTVSYRDVVNRPQFTGPYLTIGLGLANVSATKKVDVETWRAGRCAVSMSDNYGSSYKRIDVTPAPNLLDPARDTASLRPTERFYDPVVFEVPLQNIEWLHLELPARNFGGEGTLRFEIPASRINWSPSTLR